ncbi:MAG: hypothetical protein ACKPKO_63320, partial [Candidatus Fonsibacter sp.]
AQQKKHITSRTTITYQGVKYNMDVKFENGLCNCAPSKIEGYGSYTWSAGFIDRLKKIPKLPNELFAMIINKPATPPPTTRTIAKQVKGGSHYPNNRRRRRATGYQGSLSLPIHLPI